MKDTLMYALPFPAEMVSEIILRSGRHINVADLVANVVSDFLERTKYDAGIWSEEWVQSQEDDDDSFLKTYGHPDKGYSWKGVLLSNGTKLKMAYQGQEHQAEIRHGQLVFGRETMSPSEFASRVANGTTRNAWRDISVLRPGEEKWQQAATLRVQDGLP